MNEAPVTAQYQIRHLNPSDLAFVMRAQTACQYETDQLDEAQIEAGLWNQQIKGFLLIGPHSRLCICLLPVQTECILCLFYREGSPVGLLKESQMLWRKVEDYLQANGILHVSAYIHRDNPKRNKLLRFYKRLGFMPEMVRIGRGI